MNQEKWYISPHSSGGFRHKKLPASGEIHTLAEDKLQIFWNKESERKGTGC